MKQQHTLIAVLIAAQSSMLVGPRLVAQAQSVVPAANQQPAGIGILPGNPPAATATSAPVPGGNSPLAGLPVGADAASMMAGTGGTGALATAATGSGTGAANANADQAAPLLTIVDAIAVALQDNPQVGAARAGLTAAQARIGQAKAAGGLQVGVNGSGAYNQYYQATSFPGFSPSSLSGLTGAGYTEVGNVAVSYPFYTGGRVKASTRVAQANARAQAAEVLQTEQDIVLQTTQAYLNTLRAQQLLDVAESNLKVNQESYRVAQVRFDAGDVAKLDVLQAQTNLATAQQSQVSANNAVGEAKANLNTLLGRNPESPVRLELITTLTPRVPLTYAPSVSGPSAGQMAPGAGTASTAAPSTAANPNPAAVSGPAIGPAAPGNLAQPLAPPGLNAPGTLPPGPNNSAQAATNGTTAPSTGGAAIPATPATSVPSPPAAPNVAAPNVNGVGNSNANSVVGGIGAGGGLNPLNGAPQTTYTTGPLTTPVNTVSPDSATVALRTTAQGTRESLAVTQAQLEAAEASVDVAKAQRRPSIGSTLAGILRNPATIDGRYALSLGLTIAQTLFDSGLSRNQIEEAKAIVEQLKATLTGQKQAVANTIEQSLFALDTAQRNLNTSDVAVASAAEALRAAELGYSAGANTQLDVSNAQTALLTAQTTAVNARFDVATAQANIASDVGVLTAEGQAGFQRAYAAEVQQIEAQQAQQKKHNKHSG